MALTFNLSKNTPEKETKFLTLDAPPEELVESQDQIEEVENRFRRRAIELDEKVRGKLERDIWYELQDWKDSRAPLKVKLRDLNDLYEGVVKVTDFPWPNASSLHVPIPKIKAREIRSTINRNTMRPVPFLMVKYAGPNEQYEKSRDMVGDLEDFVEDKLKSSTNVHQTLKDAIIPTLRDGTCPVQIIWETEWERVVDYKMYTSASDFLNDYPSPGAAGVSSKRFSDIVRQLNSNQRYEVQYEYDVATYDGPKAYIVPLIDFVHWPVFETELSNTEMHGKRVWYKDYDIERYKNIGKFNSDAAEFVLKSPGDLRDDESLTISRDTIEGITRSPYKQGVSREYECYELVRRMDLDDDGVKEKYLIYYHWKTRKILRIERYPIRKGALTYFPLRLVRRDNRLLGMSLIEDIADLSQEIDILHRMRINSRTITHVPSFKAKASSKANFDPSRPEYRFRPGVTFWLQDINDIEQFDIRPVDLSGSIEEENFLFQIVNLVTGSDSGLSGASNPLDPRAPARKQQEQLRMSSNRIDDYVEALLGPFAQIGQFMLDLYYQYGENRIKYYVENENGDLIQKEIDRSRLYNPNVMFQVNGTSVFANPELEFGRMKEVMQILMSMPQTAQDPRVMNEALKRVLDTSRVKDYKNLLPSAAITQQIGMPSAAGPIIPTQQDKEMQAKLAVQKERLAARLSDSEKKRVHDKEMAILNAQNEQNQAMLEAELAPPAVGQGDVGI